MQRTTTEDLADLGEAVDLAIDEIETAIGEPAGSEEVSAARASVAGVKARYDQLLAALAPEERAEAQRAIGLKVAKMTGMLARLES